MEGEPSGAPYCNMGIDTMKDANIKWVEEASTEDINKELDSLISRGHKKGHGLKSKKVFKQINARIRLLEQELRKRA